MQPPPHEGLVDLVCREESRQRGESQVLAAVVDVAQRIQADYRERGSPHEVGLRGEADAARVATISRLVGDELGGHLRQRRR